MTENKDPQIPEDNDVPQEEVSFPSEAPAVHQQDSRREPYILERLEDAKKQTQKTGKTTTIKIDKKQFIKEVPAAGREPRMAFTPAKFKFSFQRLEGMTVGQLRDLCLAAKGHPFAIQKAMEVEGCPDQREVFLLHEDVNFLRKLGS